MKIFLYIVLLCNLLYAHPHTFIEIYPTIKVTDKQITKLNFVWKLDEMTSSMLIMEVDENGDNKIDKKEQKYIYENYFNSLIDYNYYTDITINHKIKLFPKPNNFKSFIKNNRLCYSFEINKNINIDQVYFDFGDQDFFVAMILKKEFVTIDGANAIVTDLDNDFYFGYRLELE